MLRFCMMMIFAFELSAANEPFTVPMPEPPDASLLRQFLDLELESCKSIPTDVLGLMLEYMQDADVEKFIMANYNALPVDLSLYPRIESIRTEFRLKASAVLSAFEPKRRLILQTRKHLIVPVMALLTAGSSLGWALYGDNIWAWQLFTSVGVVCIWPALTLPLKFHKYWIASQATKDVYVRWLVWITSGGK